MLTQFYVRFRNASGELQTKTVLLEDTKDPLSYVTKTVLTEFVQQNLISIERLSIPKNSFYNPATGDFHYR